MAVVSRHARLFTLHPLYSFQRRFIEIDAQTLASLVNRAGGVVGPNLFWEAFDFTKIGVASLEGLQSPRRRFWSTVRSDGVAIDFLLARPKREAAPEQYRPGPDDGPSVGHRPGSSTTWPAGTEQPDASNGGSERAQPYTRSRTRCQPRRP